MDGNAREMLFDTDLVWPNGITTDYLEQRIYWTDAGLHRIEYSNVNGTGRTLLATSLVSPFAITLEGDILYWTDTSEKKVFATHKLFPEIDIIVGYLRSPPYGIEAFSPDRQQDGKPVCIDQMC